MSASPLNKHLKKALIDDGPRSRMQRRGSFIRFLKATPEQALCGSNSKRRVFTAIQGRQYEGPAIYEDSYKQEGELASTVDRTKAAFIDGAGKVYNLLYEPIASPEYLAVGSALFSEFPDPNSHESFSDYNQAVSQWYSRAQQALDGVLLPDVPGRSYRRPRVGISLHGPGDSSMDSASDSLPSEDSLSLEQAAALPEAEEDMLFEKQWKLEQDPWNALLKPEEPAPASYDTFEEYEYALKNWAALCATGITVIPPHPAQLESLVLLQTYATREKLERQRSQQAMMQRLNNKEQLLIVDVEDTEVTPPLLDLPHREFDVQVKSVPLLMPNFATVDMERVFDVAAEDIAKCKKLFHDLSARRFQCYRKHRRFSQPFLTEPFFIRAQDVYLYQHTTPPVASPPKIKTDWPLYRVFPAAPDDPERNILYIHYTDLTKMEIGRLADDVEYRSACQTMVLEMDHAQRMDVLYTWYQGRSIEHNYASKKLMNQLQFSVDDVRLLVTKEELLDEFHSLLSSSNNAGDKTLGEQFAAGLDVDLLRECLQLVEDLKSKLAVGKSLHYCKKELLGELAAEMDLLTIYRLVRAVVHFSSVPIDVYPYSETTMLTVARLDPTLVDVAKQNLIVYYYGVLADYASANVLFHAPLLERAKAVQSEAIAKLQECFAHVRQYFKYAGHRSRPVAHLFLVLLVCIIPMDSARKIHNMFLNCDLVERLQELAKSRFLHTRTVGVDSINRAIAKTFLGDVIEEHYGKNKDLFHKEVMEESGWSTRLLEIAISDLRKVAACKTVDPLVVAKYQYVLHVGRSTSAFHILWQYLRTDEKCERKTSLPIARFLLVCVSTCAKLSLVCGLKSVDEGTNKGTLQFAPDDILEMIQFISANGGHQSQHAYLVKANLFKAMSTITFKLEEPFMGVCSNIEFHNCLAATLRDGNDRTFSRLAWTYFYQLIKCKSGFVPFMESKKLLNPILETITPTTNVIVLAHCLQQLGEVTMLVKKESKRLQKESLTSRGEADIKSLERDMKIICTALTKHVVKVHFIYKRMMHDNTAGYAFTALVRFYSAMASVKNFSSIGGAKLYKEFTKNKEYVANLITLQEASGKKMS